MKTKVWDGGIRLFHWVLVILFCLSSYSAFQSKFGIYGDMHTYSGISIFVLLLWRILWGFLGSDSARFAQFVRGPAQIKAYLQSRSDTQYAGHNPLGAISVVVVLLLLGAQVVLGLFASDGMLFSGPFADRIANSGDITNIHEILGYALMIWVGLHVLVVGYHWAALKSNLVKPMITGWKKLDADVAAPMISSPIKSLLCFAAAGGFTYWWIFT